MASNDTFDFVETEHSILKFWKENSIFKKSLEQTKDGKKYIFYDGPPFATGLPHHGHLLAGTLKDIIPRYFTMKGYYVERRFGWDCHGLPVEHEIDKKLGMSASDAVSKLGVKGYNDECRGIVQRYTSEWEQTVNRIGRFVDFENDYKTMDTPFMESVWWVFKQLWDKNLIYQGTKVVPFSTALGTVLSNFEATSNYRDVQDPAITVLFKLNGLRNKETYIAAWTTTPWTLPSNLGLCVGGEITYAVVKDLESNIEFIIAKDRVESYSKKKPLEIVETFTGNKLKGISYQPLFPYFSDFKNDGAFQILTDNFVTTEDGTGVVHIAPAFGEDDNRIMKEANISAIVCPVDDAGKFTHAVYDFAGVHVKEADKQIIKRLKDEGRLYDQSVIVHSYPFCPRSDTPLIYRTIPSWYVKVETFKDKLLKSNEEIYWVPDHIKHGRFGKWLEGARDWSISRNRVWGTPLPIWKNSESDDFICVGSIEELKKYSGITINNLHREYVDDIEFKIDGKPGTYKRIPEVLDCWFESGSMPYAQLHYPFENKDVFAEGFPAEFIAEGLDQTRGWFYSLTVLSTALFGKPAFRNVIVNGMIMAEDGKKMSKRLKNYTAPDVLMESFGADALRLYLINSGLVKGEEQRFADSGVKDMVRRALLPWYNSFKFFQTYALIDKWDPSKQFKYGDNIVDNWLLSKLQTLKKNIAKEMEEYKLYNVVPALFNFIEDLTNWYIRLNRNRFWGEEMSDDKCQAYSVLYEAIKEISLAMAPFSPFLAEYIYQELKKIGTDKNLKESVHLATYPIANESKINRTLEDAVDRMQQIVLLGRQKRNQEQVKVKTPLSTLTIIHKDKSLLNEIAKLEWYIKGELNIKKIEYATNESDFIKVYAKPNFRVLGKRLGKDFKKFKDIIESLSKEEIFELESNEFIMLKAEKFNTEDIQLFREAKEGTGAVSNRFISINLDCTLTDALIMEGKAREVVSRIQNGRKDSGFEVSDRVEILFWAELSLTSAINEHIEYISQETLSTIKYKDIRKNNDVFEHDIDGEKLFISLKRTV